MRTYVDVLVVSRYGDNADFIDALRQFANSVEGWQYLELQSQVYASAMGEPSCAIQKLNNSHGPAMAITKKSANTFYIANIVLRESGRISMQEYNQVASEFSGSLRTYAKSVGLRLVVKATSGLIGLKEIISGNKCRAMFERYLNLHPITYHSLDVKRLDAFICCLSRHARKPTDLELLKGWLIEEKG